MRRVLPLPESVLCPEQRDRSRHRTAQIFDYDKASSDDPMGEVRFPLGRLAEVGQPTDQWHAVQKCRGAADATGELHVKVSVLPRHALSLTQRQVVPLRASGTVAVGLGCAPNAGLQPRAVGPHPVGPPTICARRRAATSRGPPAAIG